jgi:hypothetical protein
MAMADVVVTVTHGQRLREYRFSGFGDNSDLAVNCASYEDLPATSAYNDVHKYCGTREAHSDYPVGNVVLQVSSYRKDDVRGWAGNCRPIQGIQGDSTMVKCGLWRVVSVCANNGQPHVLLSSRQGRRGLH